MFEHKAIPRLFTTLLLLLSIAWAGIAPASVCIEQTMSSKPARGHSSACCCGAVSDEPACCCQPGQKPSEPSPAVPENRTRVFEGLAWLAVASQCAVAVQRVSDVAVPGQAISPRSHQAVQALLCVWQT